MSETEFGWVDDAICDCLMAAIHGNYDGRDVESHLRRLLDKWREVHPEETP